MYSDKIAENNHTILNESISIQYWNR